ncbi:DciA family protein [Streptomyces sp. 5.8]|uniref:DciA family protein n=1 Tax=Streptomyces sp. 5.8 TaxID=3406571 RepID=UPI003BB51217
MTAPADPFARGFATDLAQVALEAARAAARAAGEPGARTAPRGRDPAAGRDPEPLGAVVRSVVTERAWAPNWGPDDILARWPEIAAELARHVRAVGFAEAEGRLDLLPDAPAYAVHLRLLGDELLRRITTAPGGERVREIRVLEPAGPVPRGSVPDSPVPDGPVQGGRAPDGGGEPSAGYRRALAAHRAGLRARSGGQVRRDRW